MAAVLGLALLSGGCTAPAASTTTAGIRAALDRRAAVVRAGLPPELPLGPLAYRPLSVDRRGDRATVRAELSYRFTGYDPGAVTAARTLELAERDGRWQVVTDRPAGGAPRQLWEQGRIDVVRGARSLVLGVAGDRPRLRGLAAVADRAVPAVSAVWPRPWARRLVVLAPATLPDMAALLGAEAAGYRGIAAVTTGETGGRPDAPADRVVVNPEAYAVLSDTGRAVVITHEAVHVATRADTSAATPLWLSEGLADWMAYRDADGAAGQTGRELREAVRAGRLPDALPDDRDFAFDADPEALARAYEGGRQACELIAEGWGESDLVAFYRAVGRHGRRAGAVEAALREVLGVTPAEFTARWRAHLRERLG